MLAIFKREFKSYFQSVIGWLFIAAILCLFGLYFVVYNLSGGYASISDTLSSLAFIFLFAVPVLTMRVISEERNKKTDQLILTAPVSLEKVVIAKFLSIAAVFSICVAIFALAPLFLAIFGSTAYVSSYVALLGFWLYGLTCIAIGTFVSCITESQVIAYVVTFLLLFLGYMMSNITNIISSTGNILTKILGVYNLMKYLTNFTNGMLDITGIVYYLSLIFLFLFFTVQVIQKRRWSMNSKSLKLGVFSSSLIIVAVAITFVLNLFVATLPSTATSIDLTKNKLYTITSKTEKFVSKLKSDVTIYVLGTESTLTSSDPTLEKTLERYQDASKHVKVVYKDPKIYPTFYSNYTSEAPASYSLIVVSEKRSKVISYNDMYETSTDYQTYQSTTTGYDGEGKITSAIQYVTSENSPTIYEITGHGETALSGDFTDVISKANITLTSLTLLKSDSVPSDAQAIIINGPTSDFSSDDVTKVKNYLAAGGKVFITTEYKAEDLPNFESILSDYGVTVAKGMVFEGDKNAYYQYPYLIIPTIQSETLTSNVSNGNVFVPYAKALTYTASSDSSITYTDLLKTSDQSYDKADIQNMTSYDKESGDATGPFTIGLDVKKTIDTSKSAELLVFSSAEMFSDSADQMVSKYNSKLFSDCITSFVDTDGGSKAIVIPTKEYDSSTVTVTTAVTIASAVILIVVLPLLLLASGIAIWAIRRKR